MTPAALLDRFLAHYYARRPVNATFTGVHTYDHALPDWSVPGLATLDAEMRALRAELDAALPATISDGRLRDDVDVLDALLARDFLDIQLAEHASAHGPRGNPALWTGEAVFGLASLMMREVGPVADRAAALTARCRAVPAFLRDAMAQLGPAPAPWNARAQRDCEGAERLLSAGLNAWLAAHAAALGDQATRLRTAAATAREAFAGLHQWLGAQPPAPDAAMACGEAFYDRLLTQGHHCHRPRAALLADARAELAREQARLAELTARHFASWADAEAAMAAAHPAPAHYLAAFADSWTRCREHARQHDVVTWPDWPLRYVPFPESTREAAPFLYYLFYRSPAPFDPYTVYDYVVPPLPADAEAAERHLRAWNDTVITLNHVVHHGAIGHHVQNWHAYHRAPSRLGRIAAVDCANRIGMFAGGSLAEGWACYATGLMEELGFLSPLEQLSEQHSRTRFLARAIVDIELHQGTMTFDDAVRFYESQVQMAPAVARAEAVKNGMFPGTAVMYWLGTSTIVQLRRALEARDGDAFTRKGFHDTLLGYGAIPVCLTARLMLSSTTDPA